MPGLDNSPCRSPSDVSVSDPMTRFLGRGAFSTLWWLESCRFPGVGRRRCKGGFRTSSGSFPGHGGVSRESCAAFRGTRESSNPSSRLLCDIPSVSRRRRSWSPAILGIPASVGNGQTRGYGTRLEVTRDRTMTRNRPVQGIGWMCSGAGPGLARFGSRPFWRARAGTGA